MEIAEEGLAAMFFNVGLEAMYQIFVSVKYACT